MIVKILVSALVKLTFMERDLLHTNLYYNTPQLTNQPTFIVLFFEKNCIKLLYKKKKVGISLLLHYNTYMLGLCIQQQNQ